MRETFGHTPYYYLHNLKILLNRIIETKFEVRKYSVIPGGAAMYVRYISFRIENRI